MKLKIGIFFAILQLKNFSTRNLGTTFLTYLFFCTWASLLMSPKICTSLVSTQNANQVGSGAKK
jgi:hypothetical protein